MKTNAEMQPKYLSYREASALSGLSRGTLWKLCVSGCVDASKVGKRVLISRQSLEDYLSSQSFVDITSR